MSEWDEAAAARLAVLVEALTGCGIVGAVEDAVAVVWARNLRDHDPDPASRGDTALSLGIRCSENLTSVLMDRSGHGEPGLSGTGLTVGTPSNSLLITAGGVRLSVMKAPPVPRGLPDPAWDAFDWSVTGVRYQAAARNSDAYSPTTSTQARRQLLLTEDHQEQDASEGAAAGLRDVMLVWAGDTETGRTAGWLGLPATGPLPWWAVQPVWRHDQHEAAPPVRAADGLGREPVGRPYDETDRPRPAVTLKRKASVATHGPSAPGGGLDG